MKHKIPIIAVIIVLILASFGSGIYTAPMLNAEVFPAVAEAGELPTAGLVPVNVSIEGASVSLTHECRTIQFDVTEDQAFAIAHGIDGTVTARPLTQDVFKDVLENFGIAASQIKIDRFEDDIYKARMFLVQGNKTLEIDLRPSDSIALATRMGKTLYVDEGVMNSKSVKTC